MNFDIAAITLRPNCKPAKRIIVLTGATRGLGRALAVEFARQGHTVLGCGRSLEGIEQLRRNLGQPHDFETVDVASDEQVKRWAGRLLPAHGPPGLLLNNAALINRNAPLLEVPADEFSSVVCSLSFAL